MTELELLWALSSTPELKRQVLKKAYAEDKADELPDAAKRYNADRVEVAVTTLVLMKAKNEDIAALLDLAWSHEDMEGDTYGKRQIVRFAADREFLNLLPAAAHGLLHDMGVSHNHDGIENDAESGQHEHAITKAFPSNMLLVKAGAADGEPLVVEGWMSTPDEDKEHDIVKAEAFIPVLDAFAGVGMPLTTEHQMYPDRTQLKRYPVGHGQKLAVVKAGQIVKEASHPTDSAEFEFFPNAGDGVWGRFAVTDADAASAIRRGNVRGFSYVAYAGAAEPRKPKGLLVQSLSRLDEATIAAFPINQSARVVAAH